MATPLSFEIHLTVESLMEDQLPAFVAFCRATGGKPLLIELARGEWRQQPMWSRVLLADSPAAALAEARYFATLLRTEGYRVTRMKLEVPATDAGRIIFPLAPSRSYFEWHGRIRLQRADALLQLCAQHGAHLSRNALREDPERRFVTLRGYTGQTRFEQNLTALRTDLIEGGWPPLKEQSECCFYDNNEMLDHGWLTV